jgi:valyl-tRNA synthetase
MPFITETIWWRLNEARPGDRSIPGRINAPSSERLIKAKWPTVGSFAEAAEHIFPKLQDVITAIRNVRNQYKVDPKKRVTVSIAPPGPDATRQTIDAKEIIELLATCTVKDVRADLPPVEKAARTSVNGCEIYLEGLIDEAAEGERSAKRVQELEKQQTALRGRLSNSSYTEKAPPHLVQQTRDQLAEVEAELAKLRS